MKPYVRKIVGVGGAVCAGYFIVPPVVCAMASLKPVSSVTDFGAPYRLLDTYTAYRAESAPLSSMNPDIFIKECGYTRDQVFSATDDLVKGSHWTPYTGYFYLTFSISEDFDRYVRQRRIDQLERRLGPYSLRFLDDCIKATAFAFVCAGEVRHVLGERGLESAYSLPTNEPRPDQRIQFNILCTYLDGLASRRGSPLSNADRSGRWPNY